MALTVGQLQVILDAQAAQFNAELRRVESSLQSFERTGNKALGSVSAGFSGLRRAAGFAFAALAALGVKATVGEFLEIADASDGLINRLRLISDGSENLAANFAAVREVALDTRTGLEDTTQLYFRLTKATERLGLSQQDQIDLTKTINQTLAVSGATAVEGSNALRQFSQGLASGTLRGEELTSVLEQIPALAQSVADGLGVPVGSLRALGAQGKLTGAAIVQALQNQAPKIAAEFSKLAPTIGQSLTNTKTELLSFFTVVNQALGGSSGVAAAIQSFNKSLLENLTGGFDAVLKGTASALEVAGELISLAELLGNTTEAIAGDILSFGETIQVVFQAINVAVSKTRSLLADTNAILRTIAVLTGVSDDLVGAADAAARANAAAADASEQLAKLDALVTKVSTNKDTDFAFSEKLFEAAGTLRAAGDKARQALADLRNAPNVSTERSAPEENPLNAKQSKELERILEQERERNRERLKGVEPLLAQRQELEDQITALKKVEGSQEAIEARDRLITELRRDQLDVTEKLSRAQDEVPQRLAQVNRLIAQLAGLDLDSSKEAKKKLDEVLAGSIGAGEKREELTKLAQELEDEIKKKAPNIGRDITSGIGEGLQELLDGGSFAEAFGQSLADAARRNLSDALDEVLKDAGDTLNGLFKSAGFGEGAAGLLGSGIIGGIGAALANSSKAGSSSSAGNIRSAVTDARQVRGVVAGPQQIGIAEVSRGIREAFLESERLLRIIASNTGAIARQSGAVAGAVDAALAGESPSFF